MLQVPAKMPQQLLALLALLSLSSLLISAQSTAATSATASAPPATYTNPILDGTGADPYVLREGEWYYMTFTNTENITGLERGESKLLFSPPNGTAYSTNLWAPEIHNIDDRWYVIFTADPYGDEPPPEQTQYCTFDCPAVNHRMYVLQSSSSSLWDSTYTLKGELNTFDQFAIDGTYFQHETGLYHIYSCWYNGLQSWPANLCITKLSNPWTTLSNLTERTTISVPTLPWEKTPYGRTSNIRLSSNEAPQILRGPPPHNKTYLIYSAARSDNPNYCLGQLMLKPDTYSATLDSATGQEMVGRMPADPMNALDWVKDTSGCVFYGDKRVGAVGVGHASFVKSADGKEDWFVYHGMRSSTGVGVGNGGGGVVGEGWEARSIRTQRFYWDETTGEPRFPRPGYGPYAVPGGQQQ